MPGLGFAIKMRDFIIRLLRAILGHDDQDTMEGWKELSLQTCLFDLDHNVEIPEINNIPWLLMNQGMLHDMALKIHPTGRTPAPAT
jgi:hypothetical protein